MQDALKGQKEFTKFENVVNQIPGAQAHVPDTYAPTFEHVIFIVGFHFPLTIKREQTIQLNGNYNFNEPSLRQFADMWIGIPHQNGYNGE